MARMIAVCVDVPKVACAPVSEPYSPTRMSPPLAPALPPPPFATSFFGGQPRRAKASDMRRSFRKLRLINAVHCKEWAHILQLEAGGVAHANRSALHDFPEDARPPTGTQRLLHFVHEPARRIFAANTDDAVAQLQFLAA